MMSIIRNPVQTFLRNFIRLVVIVPLWMLLVYSAFQDIMEAPDLAQLSDLAGAGFWTLLILWVGNILAKMIYVLPQWERIVLLRMGKSVGARGPGMFIIPPFIYSIARIIDVRIRTYEVKATKTLTRDNIPVDVTAAIELEVEDPEKAAIDVVDYWKTTEWASMEALKSTIGGNDLRPLLSETDRIAVELKTGIDIAAKDFGVNVRAVRITDVGTPQALIEELAVIARAERSAKAKQIQADAEIMVAKALSEATKELMSQEGSLQLRSIQALLDISKEESAMVIVYPASGLMGQQIAAAAAGARSGEAK